MNSLKCILIFSLINLIAAVSITGQINFEEHLIDDNTQGVACLHACNLDNDSDLDILAASNTDNQILWFRNDGGGDSIAWEKITIASNVYSAHSVYTADFDRDGDLDIVGAAYWGKPGIIWLRNDGGDPVVWTRFTVANNFINAHEVFAADIDGDNDMDILGASSDLNTIAWWRNDGGDTIKWTEQVLSDDVTLAKSVHAADFDGDKDMDIVGASINDNNIIWWRNDGGDPIVWTEFLVDGNFIGAHKVQSVDMDNDGDFDILGAAYLGHKVAWWRNDGGDTIKWFRVPIASGITNACVAQAADIDGDTDMDVVATAQGDNKIYWWRNDGNGSTVWIKCPLTDNIVRPWPLQLGDFDGDLDIDVVSASSYNGSNKVKWWKNDLLLKVNEFSSTNNLKIYPNPANKIINIKTDENNSIFKLELLDLAGNLILERQNCKNQFDGKIYLDVSSLAEGMYVLYIQYASYSIAKKIIIKHL